MRLSVYIKESRYNISLAYPVILGMLGHTITGIIDNIMVGQLGVAQLAAASLGNSIIFMAMSIGIGFSTAITPLVAEADAAKDVSKVRSVFHHGIFMCTLLGLALFIAVWLARPSMFYMGQPQEVVQLAGPYTSLVAFSLVPMIMFQGYKQFADGLAFTKYAMYAVVVANIINVILNYFLIYGIGFFPELGIVGAAVSTLVSRIVMLLYMHYIMSKNEKLISYFTGFRIKEIKQSILRRITALGVPSSMQMFFEIALFNTAIWLSGSIGKNSQAANQIALSLASLTFMFAVGLSVAATIRVGNQKGLRDYNKLKVVARSIFLLAVMIEIVFALVFTVFHNQLPLIFLNLDDTLQFSDNTEAISIASTLLIVAAVFQLSDGIQVVVLGALRGLQDVKIPTLITFVAYWVIGFPISYYLGLHTELKATGIWIGLLSGLTAAALFLYLRFHYLTTRLLAKVPVHGA
ncbi:MATE family efflux transporter [Flavobacterium rhizosphaerae]|uniref:Multidrug-efflux transporter n=1 Tax=Flavobacterium rhizosphaerae TaxID=3163298 RepID=A0ABW8YU09_9FLAO